MQILVNADILFSFLLRFFAKYKVWEKRLGEQNINSILILLWFEIRTRTNWNNSLTSYLSVTPGKQRNHVTFDLVLRAYFDADSGSILGQNSANIRTDSFLRLQAINTRCKILFYVLFINFFNVSGTVLWRKISSLGCLLVEQLSLFRLILLFLRNFQQKLRVYIVVLQAICPLRLSLRLCLRFKKCKKLFKDSAHFCKFFL